MNQRRLFEVVRTIAIVGCTLASVQSVNAEGFLSKLENAVQGSNGMQFSQWANQNPQWVDSHRDRYEYFLHHPEDAERSRSEWADWRAEQGSQMQFSEWAHEHPQWVDSHRERYEYFLHHPEDASRSRSEWADWRAEQSNAQIHDQMNFERWAHENPEWVTSHHERYEYFMHHPEDAERSRAEWAQYRSTSAHQDVRFEDWASQHQDWVNAHHDRYEYFIHHPEQAAQSRSEWYEYHH